MSGISLHLNPCNSFDTAIGTAPHHQQRLANEMTDFHDVRNVLSLMLKIIDYLSHIFY